MATQFWDDDVGYVVDGSKNEGDRDELYPGGAWDKVQIGAHELPGIARVTVKQDRKVDRQKANGRDGHTQIFRGLNNAKVDVEITIWTPRQLEALEKVIASLWPAAGKTEKAETGKRTKGGTVTKPAHGFVHPLANVYGIAAVVIMGITGLSDGSVVGTKKMTFHCEQHITATKKDATKAVKGSMANTRTVFDKEIEQAFGRTIEVAGKP